MKSLPLCRILLGTVILTCILGTLLPAAQAETPKLPPFKIKDGAAVNILEVKYKEASTPFIIPQDSYFIWAAQKNESTGFRSWKWERYGPYSLKQKICYHVHIGQVGLVVKREYNIDVSTVQANEAKIYFENLYLDRWMAFVMQFTGSQVPFNPFEYPDVSAGQQKFKGHRYALTQTAGNWDAVNEEAKQRGGHLVVIDSAEENAWLVQTFGDGPYWIGLVQYANANEPRDGWHWVGDVPSYYSNWDGGQPDNYTGRDNYGFFLQGSGGRWHDVPLEGWPPNSNYKGIIEFE